MFEVFGAKWVCDSHYCKRHKHGYDKGYVNTTRVRGVVKSEKVEPRCPLCYKEEKAEIARKKEEHKRLMEAVEIDAMFGIHFGDKCNWATNFYISTEHSGVRKEIDLEKPFRGFKTATLRATVLGRVYSVDMNRKFNAVSVEDLLKEMDTIVEMIEKKYGIEFNEVSYMQTRKQRRFVNDNIIISVDIGHSPTSDAGNISISVSNLKIKKEDNEAYLKKGFKSMPKDEGFDSL